MDDWVEIAKNNAPLDNLGDVGSGFSFELWFRTAGQTIAIHQDLFRKSKYLGNGQVKGFAMILGAPSGVVGFELNNNTPGVDVSAGVAGGGDIVDQKWHHIAVSVGGGKTALYLDGRLADAGTYPENIPFSTAEHIVLGVPRFFEGEMDEVAVYNRALTVDDVRRNCRLADPTNAICPDPKEPIILTPLPNQVLPPTRAYWSWRGERGRGGKELESVRNLTYRLFADEDRNRDGDYEKFLGEFTSVVSENSDGSSYYVYQDLTSDRGYQIRVQPVESGTTLTNLESSLPFTTDSSVVGWWKFNDGGGLYAADSSGNGYRGSLMNKLDLTGWRPSDGVDGALKFDGENDYISMGDILDGLSALTIETRIRTDTVSGNLGIVTKWSGGASYALRMSSTVPGAAQFSTETDLDSSSGGSEVVSQSRVNDGKWHHLAATCLE